MGESRTGDADLRDQARGVVVMDQVVRLDGGGQTLLIEVRAGRPHLAYWGAGLPAGAEAELDARLFERAIPHGMLDHGEAADLLPESGHGFTGAPALELSRADGGFVTQSRIITVRKAGAACRLTLADPKAGVELTSDIAVDPDTGVASFQLIVRNSGADPLRVDWAAPAALPVADDEIMGFSGRWGREFTTHRGRLGAGRWCSEARTGRTSHHAPPFLVVGEPGFGESHGRVLGLHLAWSGDHRLAAERLRDGRILLQGGELLWPGEVVLPQGGEYRSPTLYAARSDAGLNGLSDRLHPFVRRSILGGRLQGRPRPVHFNTWEAVYFRHDQAELEALAETAAAIGAERFVLDDGWFRGRDDDTTSLGDWTPDARKYPDGLGPLVRHVRGLGLEFGLWIEPEMASAASDLLRRHPDWVLGEPGREQPLGRGQHVLDLTRAEVVDEIYRQLDVLLRAHEIGYLKWDMNRDLTHPVSRGRPASRAQVLAVYGLMDRVRRDHPTVEIESCASGGGRADYEVLKRADRIWTSDCNDPLERQSIHRAFSIFFPPEVMGAHVGPADSHRTARRTSIALRAWTALFGHMGIEADVRAFPASDLETLAAAIGLHKQLRPLLHGGGRLVRQVTADEGAVAFAVIGQDVALASLAQVATPTTAGAPPLRLTGLAMDTVYSVRLLNPPARPAATMKTAPALVRGETIDASGRMIAEVGLPTAVLRAGDILVYDLKARAA
jgi:alpha-galactosidase